LRREAPPSRWRRRGRAEDCPLPGASAVARPLSRRGATEAAPPTPGGRPRYRPTGGGPPSHCTRHRGERQPGAGIARVPDALKSRECHVGRFSPRPGARLSGGRSEPVKGAPSARPFGQTLDRTTAASPPDPIAPIGLRGGAGEAPSAPSEGTEQSGVSSPLVCCARVCVESATLLAPARF
jgi:hypothetical protein